MNIDDLTISQAKELVNLFGQVKEAPASFDNGMIGKYVIVRCKDAGVHAGVLESHHGRECVLTESRRLWKWVCAKGAFLSAAAVDGIKPESKLGKEVPRIHLTENCEVVLCSKAAEKTIREQENHNE